MGFVNSIKAKLAAVLIDGEVPTGAMVALSFADGVSSRLARDGGEPADALHVTIAYLGKAVDMDEQTRELIDQTVAVFAESLTPPTDTTVAGMDLFGENNDVAVARLDIGTEAMAWAEELRDALDEIEGVEVARNFDFNPHVTVRYLADNETEIAEADDLTGQEAPIDAVTVHYGPDTTRTPLRAPQSFIAAAVARKAAAGDSQVRCPEGIASGGQFTGVLADNCAVTPEALAEVKSQLDAGNAKLEDANFAELVALSEDGGDHAAAAQKLIDNTGSDEGFNVVTLGTEGFVIDNAWTAIQEGAETLDSDLLKTDDTLFVDVEKAFGTDRRLREGQSIPWLDQFQGQTVESIAAGEQPTLPMVVDLEPPTGTWEDYGSDIVQIGIRSTVSPFGNVVRVKGSERPLSSVYRVMDEREWAEATERGFIQSDQRMNLGAEGTVASTGSTGSFYMPPRGSDAEAARIVRIKVDESDGWWVSSNDGYIKTNQPIPIDRVEAVTPSLPLFQTDLGTYRLDPKTAGFVARVAAAVADQVRCPQGISSGGQFTGTFADNCAVSESDLTSIKSQLDAGTAKLEDANPAELAALIDDDGDHATAARGLIDQLGVAEKAFIPGEATGDPNETLADAPSLFSPLVTAEMVTRLNQTPSLAKGLTALEADAILGGDTAGIAVTDEVVKRIEKIKDGFGFDSPEGLHIGPDVTDVQLVDAAFDLMIERQPSLILQNRIDLAVADEFDYESGMPGSAEYAVKARAEMQRREGISFEGDGTPPYTDQNVQELLAVVSEQNYRNYLVGQTNIEEALVLGGLIKESISDHEPVPIFIFGNSGLSDRTKSILTDKGETKLLERAEALTASQISHRTNLGIFGPDETQAWASQFQIPKVMNGRSSLTRGLILVEMDEGQLRDHYTEMVSIPVSVPERELLLKGDVGSAIDIASLKSSYLHRLRDTGELIEFGESWILKNVNAQATVEELNDILQESDTHVTSLGFEDRHNGIRVQTAVENELEARERLKNLIEIKPGEVVVGGKTAGITESGLDNSTTFVGIGNAYNDLDAPDRKHRVVSDLETLMNQSGTIDMETDLPPGRTSLYHAINGTVAEWAASSQSPESVAVQLAVEKLFGTGDNEVVEGMATYEAGFDLYDGSTLFYDQFATAVYRNTQAALAEAGITEMSLYRGMHFNRNEAPVQSDLFIGENDWDMLDFVGLDGEYEFASSRTDQSIPFIQMPLSSWSVSEGTANEFAAKVHPDVWALMSATVPAESVFSTALTGPGSLYETEIITIQPEVGNTGTTQVVWGLSDYPEALGAAERGDLLDHLAHNVIGIEHVDGISDVVELKEGRELVRDTDGHIIGAQLSDQNVTTLQEAVDLREKKAGFVAAAAERVKPEAVLNIDALLHNADWIKNVPEPEGFVARVTAAASNQSRCPEGIATGGEYTGVFADNCAVNADDLAEMKSKLDAGTAKLEEANPAELAALVDDGGDHAVAAEKLIVQLGDADKAFIPGEATGDPAASTDVASDDLIDFDEVIIGGFTADNLGYSFDRIGFDSDESDKHHEEIGRLAVQSDPTLDADHMEGESNYYSDAWNGAAFDDHNKIPAALNEVFFDGPEISSAADIDLVKATYVNTQRWLEERGIDHLTVHRAMKFEEGFGGEAAVNAITQMRDSGERNSDGNLSWDNPSSTMTQSILSSWSAKESIAATFGKSTELEPLSVMLSATIPASAVYSLGNIGMGVAEEGEVIVIRPPGESHVYAEWSNRTFDSPDSEISFVQAAARRNLSAIIDLDEIDSNKNWIKAVTAVRLSKEAKPVTAAIEVIAQSGSSAFLVADTDKNAAVWVNTTTSQADDVRSVAEAEGLSRDPRKLSGGFRERLALRLATPVLDKAELIPDLVAKAAELAALNARVDALHERLQDLGHRLAGLIVDAADAGRLDARPSTTVTAAVESAQQRCPQGVRTGGQFTGIFADNCEVSYEEAVEIAVAIAVEGTATVDQMNPAELFKLNFIFDTGADLGIADASLAGDIKKRLESLTVDEAVFIPGVETGDPDVGILEGEERDRYLNIQGPQRVPYPDTDQVPLNEWSYQELLVARSDIETDESLHEMFTVELRYRDSIDERLLLQDMRQRQVEVAAKLGGNVDAIIDLDPTETRWNASDSLAALEVIDRFADDFPEAAATLESIRIKDLSDTQGLAGAAGIRQDTASLEYSSYIQLGPNIPFMPGIGGGRLPSETERVEWAVAHELGHVLNYADYAKKEVQSGLKSLTTNNVNNMLERLDERHLFAKLFADGNAGTVTRYAEVDVHEFFAESFAASYTGHMGLSPNVQEALDEYMERRKMNGFSGLY